MTLAAFHFNHIWMSHRTITMNNRQVHAAQIEDIWRFFYDKYNLPASDIFFISLNRVFSNNNAPLAAIADRYAEQKDLSFTEDEQARFHQQWHELETGLINFFETIHQDDDVFTRKCGKIAETLIDSGFNRMEAAAFSEMIHHSMETVIAVYEAFPDLGEMISDVLGDTEDTFIGDFQESCLWLKDSCTHMEDLDALYEDHMDDVVFITEHAILFSAMAFVVYRKTSQK